MKNCFALLLLLLPFLAMAQLRGTYGYHFTFESESISFLDSDKFNYRFSSDVGGRYGTGFYALSEDSLVLHFTGKYPEKHDTLIVESLAQADDVGRIKVFAYDSAFKENLPLNFRIYSEKAKIDINGTTGMDGKGLIELPGLKDSCTITFFDLSSPLSYPIFLDRGYNIKVYSYSHWNSPYQQGDTLVFQMGPHNKRRMYLRRLDKYQKSFDTYKRQKR
jgi:hypothetical protein